MKEKSCPSGALAWVVMGLGCMKMARIGPSTCSLGSQRMGVIREGATSAPKALSKTDLEMGNGKEAAFWDHSQPVL